MVKAILVDDDREQLYQMREYMNRFSKEEGTAVEVMEFQDGLNFVEDYDGQADVIFLDIEMPHLDGLEAARRLRERDTSVAILFVTNMAQYAIRGYEVNAVDFVVKPVGYYAFADKLKKALALARRNIEKQIVITVDDMVIKMKCSQILYIEKDKNYLLYHTEKEDYRIRGTLSQVEEKLKQENFSRCISGCLVNLRHVNRLEHDTVLVGQQRLPVSRQRKKEFKDDFMRYLGGVI